MPMRIEPVIEIEAGSVTDSRTEEIYRNLKLLYGTVAGEQGLDREFGIDGDLIDYPMESAMALFTAEYVRKTERYEPRVRVKRVDWSGLNAKEGIMTPKVVVSFV